ncbi:MAG: MarR family transcriptional regulator [Myxococcales bacterium]|nr:MarR family transcriptional regulator [Myxococcales bacterium]MDD9969618.1 MarR family transcriptional regulator [Myxococcales bacterium]
MAWTRACVVPNSPIDDDILRALRRITRAIDLHSRKLANTFGLTGPQLVCLRVLADVESATPSFLAKEVALSQGTITGIIDRLVLRQLVQRTRATTDRRLVTVTLTNAGRALVKQAPSPLQETFTEQLAQLPAADQARLRDTLEQVVRMMGGEEIEAAPILSTSPTAQSPEEVQDVLDTGETDLAIVADIAPSIDPPTSE